MTDDPFDQPPVPLPPQPPTRPSSTADPGTTDPGPGSAGPGLPPAPTPMLPPPPVARQLVRDPYTKLGGVASGLGHHYGIDVSIIRLAFVIFTFFTGFGLLIYLLAWLIVPRAQYWPPVNAPRPNRTITARELALGLVALGVLIALFLGGGGLSQVLVPVALVGGGLWLLVQHQAQPSATAPDGSSIASPYEPPTAAPSPPPLGTIPPGTPVPPRRRAPAMVVGAVLLVAVGLPMALIAVLIATAAVTFENDGGVDAMYRPGRVEDIPTSITEGAGSILLDLTALEPSMFEGESVPIDIDIDLDLGEVVVLVPEDVPVNVDAEVDIGEVSVFDDTSGGFSSEVRKSADDPLLQLDITVDAGDVQVDYVEE